MNSADFDRYARKAVAQVFANAPLAETPPAELRKPIKAKTARKKPVRKGHLTLVVSR